MLNRLVKKLRENPVGAAQVLLVFAVGLALRFVDLGYSNFQGDEINAICRPSNFSTVVKFLGYLLGQQRGPAQYVVSCLYGLIDPAYTSELALRLPSAIASLLSVVCFLTLAWRLFNWQAAFYGGLLVATNGVFVSMARSAQYQAFVQLGVTASLMGMILATQDSRWRIIGLYLAAVAAAGAMLAHFDGAWALPPLGLLVIRWWRFWRVDPAFRRLRAHAFGAGALYALLVLGFYVEYVHRLSSYQLDYWDQRFSGSSTNTLLYFQFFNPGPVAWLYAVAVLLALVRARPTFGWLIAGAWLIPPLIFVELVFRDSRGSAYVYFLPLCLFGGIGISSLNEWLEARRRPVWGRVGRGFLIVSSLSLGLLTYQLLVDHDPEYPWQPKTIAGMTVPGGNIEGLLGLPYNRGWRGIGAWFSNRADRDAPVVTNEKLVVAMFYLPSDVSFKYIWRDAPTTLPDDSEIYFLIIDRPQSWIDQVWGRNAEQWQLRFPPDRVFHDPNGRPVAWVYHLSHDQLESVYH